MIAFGDAGRTMGVWPSLAAQIGEKGAAAYSVTFDDVDGGATTYPSFDRLPAPDQAIALLRGPTLGTRRQNGPGKTAITLDPKAL